MSLDSPSVTETTNKLKRLSDTILSIFKYLIATYSPLSTQLDFLDCLLTTPTVLIYLYMNGRNLIGPTPTLRFLPQLLPVNSHSQIFQPVPLYLSALVVLILFTPLSLSVK